MPRSSLRKDSNFRKTDCFPVLTVKPTRRKPGITKPAATLDQSHKRRPLGQHQVEQREKLVKRPQRTLKVNPNRLNPSLQLRKRAGAGTPWDRDIRLPVVQAPPHRVEGSRRRCSRRTSLTI